MSIALHNCCIPAGVGPKANANSNAKPADIVLNPG